MMQFIAQGYQGRVHTLLQDQGSDNARLGSLQLVQVGSGRLGHFLLVERLAGRYNPEPGVQLEYGPIGIAYGCQRYYDLDDLVKPIFFLLTIPPVLTVVLLLQQLLTVVGEC
uniref:Uncharacterized protein n=1 Tax=Cacopsylla melanoneura TaxID=428564 RepID=A0A8D8WXP9_9HEMI